MKLLIVEDNKIYKASIEKTLEPYFDQIDYALNGKMGLILWTRYQHDVVITDIQLPLMGGYELIEEIRLLEEDKYTYIIALTVESKVNVMKNSGFDDYVVKPFSPENLVSRLGRGLDMLGIVRQYMDEGNNIFSIKRWSQKSYITWHLTKVFLENIQQENDFREILDDDFCHNILNTLKILNDIKMNEIEELMLFSPMTSTFKNETILVDNFIITNVIYNKSAKKMSKSELIVLRNISLFQSEWFDGSGMYGLTGSEIPICARIVNIMTAFTNLRLPQQQRMELTKVKVQELIENMSNKRFDPKIASYLLKNINEYDSILTQAREHYLSKC